MELVLGILLLAGNIAGILLAVMALYVIHNGKKVWS